MKIGHKLYIAFGMVIFIMMTGSFFSAQITQTFLRQSLGEHHQLLARETMDKIDREIHHRIEEISQHGSDLILQEAVRESNLAFAAMVDRQGWIMKQDQEWRAAPEGTPTPFMQTLMNNRLAEELREKQKFYEHEWGYAVYPEMFITNKHGAIIATTGRTSDYFQADEDWYQRATSQKKYLVTDVEYDESAKTYAVNIVVKLQDENREFAGTLKAVLNIDTIKSIINQEPDHDSGMMGHDQHPDMHFKLLTKDGRLIFSSGSSLPFLSDLSDDDFMRQIRNGPPDGFFVMACEESGKKNELFSYTRSRGYHHFKGLGWILTIEHGAEEIFAPVYRLKQYLWVITAAVALIGFVLTFRFSRSITQPVLKLCAAASSIGHGDLDTEIPAETNDEIGTLAQTFKIMTLELKSSQAKHIEAREYTDNIMRSMLDCLIILSPDGYILSVNRPTCTLLEYQEEELTRLSVKDIFAQGKKFGDAILAELIKQETIKNLDVTFQTRNKVILPISLNTSLMRDPRNRLQAIILVARDMRDSKLLEKLRVTTQQLELKIVEHQQAKKALQQRTHDLNERVKEINCLYQISNLFKDPNISLDEILKKSVELMPPAWLYPEITCARIKHDNKTYQSKNFSESAWRQAQAITVDQHDIGCVEVFYLQEMPTLDEGPFIREERSLINAIAKRFSDAIEYQRLHQEKSKMQSFVYQQEKLASIGQLAAGIAHEINNPVGFISSNLHTLKKYAAKLNEFTAAQTKALASATRDDETLPLRKELKIDTILNDLNSLVDESLEGATRITEIVRNLKNFSRVDEAKFQEADINQCLENTIKVLWNELKYKTELIKEYGELPLIKCYPQQLNQVFLNLLLNAAQAIAKTGKIRIKTWTEAQKICISISDTGAGIAPENLTRLFEPFFTTKEVGHGTGLGLSIADDIIRKHNGKISVVSELGKGTCFTIKIPRLPVNDAT